MARFHARFIQPRCERQRRLISDSCVRSNVSNTVSALLKFTDSPITALDYHQYNGGIYNHRPANLDCGVDSTNAICDAYGSLLFRLSQCWMRYIPFICPLGCAGTRVQGMISPVSFEPVGQIC